MLCSSPLYERQGLRKTSLNENIIFKTIIIVVMLIVIMCPVEDFSHCQHVCHGRVRWFVLRRTIAAKNGLNDLDQANCRRAWTPRTRKCLGVMRILEQDTGSDSAVVTKYWTSDVGRVCTLVKLQQLHPRVYTEVVVSYGACKYSTWVCTCGVALFAPRMPLN